MLLVAVLRCSLRLANSSLGPLLKVLYPAVLFCERSLHIAIGLLCVVKSVLQFIELCMQIAELSLHALISIDFDAVDECGPGILYSVFGIDML